MPKQATLQVRMDEETKARAEKLFAALGLTLSEAVRLFMAQSVNERRLPFTPRLNGGEGGDGAFGKLRPYGKPNLNGEARAVWLREQGERAERRQRRVTRAESDETTIVDETMLLHYLLDDEPRAAAQARRIIGSGAARVYPETMVALVDALETDYRVPRSLIGTVVELLIDDVTLDDAPAIRLASRLYPTARLPYRACLLVARSTLTGYPVESLDKAVTRAAR